MVEKDWAWGLFHADVLGLLQRGGVVQKSLRPHPVDVQALWRVEQALLIAQRVLYTAKLVPTTDHDPLRRS